MDLQKIKEIVKTDVPDAVRYMVQTKEVCDACLSKGCLPVPVNSYKPTSDLNELQERGAQDKKSELWGIDWHPSTFLANLHSLAVFAEECDWPNNATGNPTYFHLDKGDFSYGCAAALHSMIRKYKPHRIIEIGSGNSSRVIAAALRMNVMEDETNCPQCTIIDPCSGLDVAQLPKGTVLLKKPVESINPVFFQSLTTNDILFIDSSHGCIMRRDIHFEILEILPILNRGVLVHFHDIPMPYEYPKTASYTPTLRTFWTESYLLQAFLSGNSRYEIILPMCYLQTEHADEFRTLFPKGNQTAMWGSGSFWLRRTTLV